MRKDVLVLEGIRSNISDFGIDMIPEIPSIDPTSTCLHAENPQAKLARGREKSATLLLAEFATFYAKRETSP